MNGRPINQDRQLAISLGFLTYEGSVHTKCGTTTRYTKGAGCVHCARLIATEQREARNFLRSSRGTPPPEREAAQNELDNIDEVIQDEMVAEARDDAAERFRRDLEDLM